jgi:hypothetical protein
METKKPTNGHPYLDGNIETLETHPGYLAAYRMLGKLQKIFIADKDYPWETIFNLLAYTRHLFDGKIEGFQACDTGFHDLDHTMYVVSALADLLIAYHQKNKSPGLATRHCQIGIASALFHDIGYLKYAGDYIGTGAKFSAIHVKRSCQIALKLLPDFQFNKAELAQVQNSISATALGGNIDRLPFQSEQEFVIAALLVTSDFISQMAVQDYPERLEKLYFELQEANRHSSDTRPNFGTFRSLLELLQSTNQFFSEYVLKLLNTDLRGYYHLLDNHEGANPYIAAIKKNIIRTNSIADLLSKKS